MRPTAPRSTSPVQVINKEIELIGPFNQLTHMLPHGNVIAEEDVVGEWQPVGKTGWRQYYACTGMHQKLYVVGGMAKLS